MRHFGKIIRALEKEPLTSSKYYAAYPVLAPLTGKGEWQPTEPSRYASCNWCIDALLANSDAKERGKYNIVSFDFATGHTFGDKDRQY